MCHFCFSRFLIELYLAHWLFLEQGGTWWQYGSHKWYAIRKSLRTTALVAWFSACLLPRHFWVPIWLNRLCSARYRLHCSTCLVWVAVESWAQLWFRCSFVKIEARCVSWTWLRTSATLHTSRIANILVRSMLPSGRWPEIKINDFGLPSIKIQILQHMYRISGLRMRRVTWNRFSIKNICWFIRLGLFCRDKLV